LQYLTVVGEEWRVENGLVTPTMKIKRAAIEEHYGKRFQPWYDSGELVVWEST